MGCSPSTLSTISDSILTSSMIFPSTTNPTRSAPTSPPVLHPPLVPIGNPPSVDLHSDNLNDSWELIDDPDYEDYHLVDHDKYGTLHKLLETYEFVEGQQDLSAAVDYKGAQQSLFSYESEHFSEKGKTDEKVVLYVTSMRGIRKTYDDCCAIKQILNGFRVVVDERDIAMDVKYRKELQSLLGLEGKPVAVPQLFVGAKYVGGADQVRELYELDALSRLLEGCRVRGSTLVPCVCGNVRFILCAHCNGSKKVFDEDCSLLRKCSHCNENGLVECPSCNH